jgi:hypothetical protein
VIRLASRESPRSAHYLFLTHRVVVSCIERLSTPALIIGDQHACLSGPIEKCQPYALRGFSTHQLSILNSVERPTAGGSAACSYHAVALPTTPRLLLGVCYNWAPSPNTAVDVGQFPINVLTRLMTVVTQVASL